MRRVFGGLIIAAGLLIVVAYSMDWIVIEYGGQDREVQSGWEVLSGDKSYVDEDDAPRGWGLGVVFKIVPEGAPLLIAPIVCALLIIASGVGLIVAPAKVARYGAIAAACFGLVALLMIAYTLPGLPLEARFESDKRDMESSMDYVPPELREEFRDELETYQSRRDMGFFLVIFAALGAAAIGVVANGRLKAAAFMLDDDEEAPVQAASEAPSAPADEGAPGA